MRASASCHPQGVGQPALGAVCLLDHCDASCVVLGELLNLSVGLQSGGAIFDSISRTSLACPFCASLVPSGCHLDTAS